MIQSIRTAATAAAKEIRMTATLSQVNRAANDADLFTSPLDPGIAEYVLTLRAAGVETFESCQGGPGHALPDPTVLFHGERSAGWHALAVAQDAGLPILAIRRAWQINDGEPSAPCWEMVFRRQGAPM